MNDTNERKNSRVLIVGTGSIGERHLRCFQQTGRVQVAACEVNEELRTAVAGKYGVTAYAGLEEALAAGDILGVAICTPAHLHVSMARTVAEAGLPVLIEKPLATTEEGLGELVRLVAEKGLIVKVAYVMRCHPTLQKARAFLQTGELGAPLHMTVVGGQHFPTFRPAYRNTYYARHETGGGAIQDALTHSVNAVEWFLGPTESLFCDAAHKALEGVAVEDTVNVVARNGGVLVNYGLNQFQAPNEKHYSVHCEKGSIRIEMHANRWGVCRHGDADWTWHEAPPMERDSLFIAQANAFLDAIENKPGGDLCSLEEAIHTLRFNLAALDSAASGRSHTVPGEDEGDC